LITTGPYKYSRNPQYVGMVLFFAGSMLFFNSLYTSITGLIGIIWFLLLPFIEEPWLEEQIKEEYYKYRKKVPRFL
jgi:protein-S-isoprenylcysteine O-methyltransferase Ste14